MPTWCPLLVMFVVGGKYDTNLVASLLLSPTVKEFLKPINNISQSYERISSGTFFMNQNGV